MKTRIAVFLVILVLTAPLMAFDAYKGTESGGSYYAIKLVSLTSAVTNTVAFGFKAKKVAIETPSTNTTDICLDWTAATTVTCPATDTSGADLIPANREIVLDDMSISGLSMSVPSGTQSIYIRAWK